MHRKITLLFPSEQITDIYLIGDTVTVKMLNTKRYAQKGEAFGYTLKIDSTATSDDYDRIYQPMYYKRPKATPNK